MKICNNIASWSFLTFLLCSCTNKVEELTPSVYFDLYRQGDNSPEGSYRFYKDGYCEYYKYDKSTGKRAIFVVDDVIYKKEWTIRGDTLSLRGYKYFAKRMIGDSIAIFPIESNEKEKILILSKVQP